MKIKQYKCRIKCKSDDGTLHPIAITIEALTLDAVIEKARYDHVYCNTIYFCIEEFNS